MIVSSRTRGPLLVLAILAALRPASARAAAAPSVTITVLHTSDLHGEVHPQDALQDRDLGEGLARIGAAVRQIRAEGRPTLLFDSGDTIQGSPEQALALTAEGGRGVDPIVAAMNTLRYDAMAVGNHEFDFGRERLALSRGQARFPFLSANMVEGGGQPAFPPYIVKTVGGVRIGILGLITRLVASWEPPSRIAGLQFLDSVEAAARYVPILRGKERCDLVIVLTHQGFERDLETGASSRSGEENRGYALATEVPGIDLLLTGHTHTVVDPRRLKNVWVSQPGRYGNTLTRFDVTLSRKGRRWEVAEVQGRNLPMKGVVPDPEIVRLATPSHDAAMAYLGGAVARLPEPLSARNARTQDTPVLDWLHEVQIREGAADLSVASLLPGSLAPWPAGDLTVRQVWSFYIYENTLVTLEATGRQVREALEGAGRCISGIESSGDGFAWKRNPAVWGYDCDTLSGAEYALDPTRPEGQRLLYLRRGGHPVADGDLLRVALNSYRASGGGGYPVWKDCRRVAETETSIRDLLLQDARRRKELVVKTDENWFLAPSLPEGPFRFPR